MQFKFPKDDEKYHWTQHIVRKMMYYGLSADRIKRTIRYPKRCEEGIVPGTIAVMQPAGHGKRPTEIWVMYRETRDKRQETGGKGGKKLSLGRLSLVAGHSKKIVITAWRYPGTSPVRHQIPIPANILAELKDEGLI